MNETIKIGDEVMWRGNFNHAPARVAIVTRIEITPYLRCKYGESVPEVQASQKDYCVFVLSSGHWAYGEQIDTINQEAIAEDYELYYSL
jgi:hypothetical protein